MLKVVVCSIVLMVFIYFCQKGVYWVFDYSYLGGFAVCFIGIAFAIIAAVAIDRSRTGPR